NHEAYFHVDAAQGFGKELTLLSNRRIDLVSISGHKIYAPKGIGALVTRRRESKQIPLRPQIFGGGQERGLRAGTLPVPLIVGLGTAAEIALPEHTSRIARNEEIRLKALNAFSSVGATVNGDPTRSISSTLNVSIPGLDSEAVMLALKDVVAISNGSACTSQSYQPSHVLAAMGLPEDRIAGAVRLSWCYMTEAIDWAAVVGALKQLM